MRGDVYEGGLDHSHSAPEAWDRLRARPDDDDDGDVEDDAAEEEATGGSVEPGLLGVPLASRSSKAVL